MKEDRHFKITMNSPFGELTLVATNQGLRALTWPNEQANRLSRPDEMTFCPDHPILIKARIKVEEYLDGQHANFDIPLDLRGTKFQRDAWLALATIPYGTSTSYGQQAALIGKPKAVRAIGAANGRNPISIILPCHRVIGANGDLTGYGGGLNTKRRLLAFELENKFQR